MNPERWKQIDQLLSSALQLPPEERAAFLAEACGKDDDLRKEVEALLSSDRHVHSSIIDSPKEIAAALIGEPKNRFSSTQTIGPYKIMSLLGTGGMGEVYRAKDVRLGRDVAIKILPAELSQDHIRLSRFKQEARSASSLNHPNIITIHDIGSFEGGTYIAMEFIEGKTLREIITSGHPSLQKAVDIAAQIVNGLAKAHEAGIVHRDLKPENIMITKDGYIKILDFGLAKQSSESESSQLSTQLKTADGTILGTVAYMSPEQAGGQSINYHSDQFSFGTILYELITGRNPFQRKTSAETLSAIINDELPRLETPAPIQWIVERCLQKDPEARYVSTRDLARELHTIRLHFSDAMSSAKISSTQSIRKSLRLLPALTTILLVTTALLTFFLLKKPKENAISQPSYQRVTFRRGTVYSARFAPDGHSIVYSAAWDGNPIEVFTTFPETPESRPLGLTNAKIVGISKAGELALLIGSKFSQDLDIGFIGTLARVPLTGGAPRELVEDVISADWMPDGKSLVVIRHTRDEFRLEFPIGNAIYETPNIIRDLRVSPEGNLVAFYDQGPEGIVVIDKKGNRKILSQGWNEVFGTTWNNSGDEVWFTAAQKTLYTKELHAVTLAGKDRLILRSANEFYLQDISPSNRILLMMINERSGINFRGPNETRERELGWFDYSFAMDLSKDGKKILINEVGEGTGGQEHVVFIRDTNGSPAIRLGEGIPTEFSPEGKWVIAVKNQNRQLVLIPTGTGEPRDISQKIIEQYRGAYWLPNGNQVVFQGKEKNHGYRLYVQDITRPNPPKAITPEQTTIGLDWTSAHPVSPDGRLIVVLRNDGKYWLYPIDEGEPRPISGLDPNQSIVASWANGHELYVSEISHNLHRVYLFDPIIGTKKLWKEWAPNDPAGVIALWPPLISFDSKSYAQNYNRVMSDLYLANGIK